jgi:aspartyl-tRNA(Asn)/glutamyl-tRNA(Gln) amidotransferase subunit A
VTAVAEQISSNDLHALAITEACELIRRKALSPVELTQALLDRAEQLDPKINAYILATPDLALQQAKQAERAIMAGNYRGAMHGIPYGAKDVFAAAGIATTGHSKAYADAVPATDATAIARLARAGAVLLGKLSTHECAHGGPSFDLPWPPARNPWDLARFSGGSSSGSAAGIAAGLMPAALGTDTGGSIRIPAALCGTVGLKPTYGLVSRHGVMPNSFTYDHAGPLTWTVEDCAIVLQALAGYDEMDPASASPPIPDYRAALTGDIRGLRIGVLRHLHETDLLLPPVCGAALEQAYGVLRSLGAVLEDAAIRPAQDYYDVKITIAESEIYAVHEQKLRGRASDFGEDFLGRTLAAVMIRASDYVQAQRERRIMLAEMEQLYAKYDVLLAAGPGPAALLDAWRTIAFWQKPNLTTPFNVTGGPALMQCIGFTPEGLPLSMQIVGKPFDEATVLRVADAYERATSWRARRPRIDGTTAVPQMPPVPEPAKADITATRRDEIAALCGRAGLVLNERQFEQLCATAPYIDAMVGRLHKDRRFDNEPMNVFRLPGSGE